jgi:hypothetical protein
MAYRGPLAAACRVDARPHQSGGAHLQSAAPFPLDGGHIYRDLLARIAPRSTSARVIAALGVVVGLRSTLAGLRTDIVLLLIGVEMVILNWAILKQPADAAEPQRNAIAKPPRV